MFFKRMDFIVQTCWTYMYHLKLDFTSYHHLEVHLLFGYTVWAFYVHMSHSTFICLYVSPKDTFQFCSRGNAFFSGMKSRILAWSYLMSANLRTHRGSKKNCERKKLKKKTEVSYLIFLSQKTHFALICILTFLCQFTLI